MHNYINMIFGGMLGFILSLLLQLFKTLVLKKQPLKLLKLEYPEISKILTGLVNSAEKVKGISSTEIPNFHFVVQTEYLLHLQKDIRSSLYSNYKQLEHTERLRVQAHPLIGAEGHNTELQSYGMLYLSCLKAARVEMDKLIESIT